MNFSGASLTAAFFALCTALFWGTYGPLLAKGHGFMHDDGGAEGRLRPFICVGIAYLLVAIVAPVALMYATGMEKYEGVLHGWTFRGVLWSILAGGVGALGAFTLIMAINYGGAPSTIYVMPIVFGLAPVVSTFTTMYFSGNLGKISPFFAAGLILAAAGAITILVTAPRPQKPSPTKASKESPAAAVKQVAETPKEPKPQKEGWTGPEKDSAGEQKV